MIDTVEAIAPDIFREPLIGSRICCRRQRHPAMEAGVEHGHLWNIAQQGFDCLDAFECSVIMERSKCCNTGNSLLDRGRDLNRFLIAQSTVNDPMSDHINVAGSID